MEKIFANAPEDSTTDWSNTGSDIAVYLNAQRAEMKKVSNLDYLYQFQFF